MSKHKWVRLTLVKITPNGTVGLTTHPNSFHFHWFPPQPSDLLIHFQERILKVDLHLYSFKFMVPIWIYKYMKIIIWAHVLTSVWPGRFSPTRLPLAVWSQESPSDPKKDTVTYRLAKVPCVMSCQVSDDLAGACSSVRWRKMRSTQLLLDNLPSRLSLPVES